MSLELELALRRSYPPKLLDSAFITGSRAYGVPRPDSDLDIVVLVNAELGELLTQLADPMKVGEKGITRFGNLNLIVTYSQEEFDCWRIATADLVEMSINHGPVSRETAVKYIDMIFEQRGVNVQY